MSMRIDSKIGGHAPLQQKQSGLTAQEAQQAKQIDLHQYSSYEKVDSVTFDDGSSLAVPQLGAGQDQQLRTMYAGLSTEQEEQLRAAGGKLATAMYEALGDPQAYGPDGQLNVEWISGQVGDEAAHTFENYMLTTGDRDFEASVGGVIMMGVEELQDQLGTFAGYVQGNLDTQKDMRADLADIREVLGGWPAGAETQPFTWTERRADGTVVEHVDEPLTRGEAEDLMTRLEGELDTMRDMGELDKFKLQDLYQRYNQAISTLSNIMKMQHDTLKGIINNLK